MLRARLSGIIQKHSELIPAVFPKSCPNRKPASSEIEPDLHELKHGFEMLLEVPIS